VNANTAQQQDVADTEQPLAPVPPCKPEAWVDVSSRYASDTPVNAMSVDVEDYFQVSAFESNVRRSDWRRIPLRVEANVERILTLFSEQDVRATFFTLGWICERCPQLVRSIVDAGHELASHGYDHTRAVNQDRESFRRDVERTRATLEDVSGTRIRGYRAASYSIGEQNLWALDVLEETGHEYSSSIYPIRHDLYGMPSAPRFAFETRPGGLLELPVSTVEGVLASPALRRRRGVFPPVSLRAFPCLDQAGEPGGPPALDLLLPSLGGGPGTAEGAGYRDQDAVPTLPEPAAHDRSTASPAAGLPMGAPRRGVRAARWWGAMT
jgi:hypothetical protein